MFNFFLKLIICLIYIYNETKLTTISILDTYASLLCIS